MKIILPFKIHNKFEIVVKDTATGTTKEKGYAENIVLDNFATSNKIMASAAYFGNSIQYGTGVGTLDPTRTTLFNRLGGTYTIQVERNWSQAPVPSYSTKKIVINPDTHTGQTLTEVGIGEGYTSSTIFTHALIKDSEGNPLALGPLEATDEVTIYATVYCTPNFEDGITLFDVPNNSLLAAFTGWSEVQARANVNNIVPQVKIGSLGKNAPLTQPSAGVLRVPLTKFLTSEVNGKIKSLRVNSNGESVANANFFVVDLETLAEEGSTIWGGHAFDQTQIGVGDGNKTVFNLLWDEAWLAKPYAVYVDGVAVSTGVTFSAGTITFDTAPANEAIITADYWVKYAPKDTDHEFWVDLQINFGEGTPS